MKRLPLPPNIGPLQTDEDRNKAIQAILQYLIRLQREIEPTLPES